MSVEVKGPVSPAALGSGGGFRKSAASSAGGGSGKSVSRRTSSRSSIRVLPSTGTINGNNSPVRTECPPASEVSLLPIISPSSPMSISSSGTEDSPTKEQIPDHPLPPPRVSSSSIQIISSSSPSLALIRSISSRPSIANNPPFNPQDVPRRWMTSDRLNELRKRTHEAIRNHKVFSIRGCFVTVRKALMLRGYVEKLDLHRKAAMPLNLTMDEMLHQLPNRQAGESRRQYISKCERNIVSRFLEHTPVDFLWTFRKEKADWIDMARNPNLTTNKFHKVPFTTKEGICSALRDFHWFYIDGLSEMYYPRCYNVFNPDELEDFVEDFRLTACISLIRFVIDTFNNKGASALLSSQGTIPVTSLQFAIKRAREYVNFCEHQDVDSCEDRVKIWDHDWDVFLAHHYYLTHENGMIAETQMSKPFDVFLSMAAKVLQDIEPFWPQFNIDGHLNIWIVKPANRCRGKGILLMNNIKKIISLVNPSTITKTRFVVQKYMERPLTIYNTKFDIRQWFLITSVQPLCIWMYRESYLRFSSQEYNLLNYHESVHLTNYAVQKKYAVNQERDERLPSENMWDSYTFQAYLRQIGKQDMWDERIYPGMQRAIIGTLLASQDNMDRRPNTFELFGADFMICENYYPWLIEINSSPDLGNTTSVTARMCPQCLEDTVKVVVDRKNDAKADTGGFELIYKQVIPPSPAYMGLNLSLKGQQITQKSSAGGGGVKRDKLNGTADNRHHLKQIVSRNISSSYSTNGPASSSSDHNKLRKGPVIMDLIDCLDVKQQHTKRQMSRTVAGGVGMARSSQGYLKSKNKVDVDYKEKNNSSSRRHHSCGPVLRQQTTMKNNTPRVVEDVGVNTSVEEPFIVPALQQQQVAQGDSNFLRSFSNRVDLREEIASLPPVNNSSRKSSCESVGRRIRMSPKGK